MNPAGRITVCSLVALFSTVAYSETVYNIALAEDGHYRVQYEQLLGFDENTSSDQLFLFEQGRPIPLQVNDGGDGLFGPGDNLQFVGRRLAGTYSWYDEDNQHNVFQLSVGAQGHRPEQVGPAAGGNGIIIEHLEQDNLRVALPHSSQPGRAERWYWQRISHVADESFRHYLAWPEPPQLLRISLTGLSYDQHATTAGLAQHMVVVYFDGVAVAETTWDGQESTTLEIHTSGLAHLDTAGAWLEIRVPSRVVPGTGQQLVDAVLLNWMELEFAAPTDVPATIPDRDGLRRLKVAPGWLAPVRVERAAPYAGLASTDQQADYLMISHPDLLDALAPLAAFHRARGMTVKVVDVRSVYDEFSHGVPGPAAVQSFIAHAWHHWRKPAPALVLLAGDASWGREADGAASRNLVPTFQAMVEGHLAASDNALVSIAGDDWRPDLAIGRLPAANAAELSVMVEKALQHGNGTAAGGGAQRTVWIAGSETEFQAISHSIASTATAQGLSADMLFPENLPASNGQSPVVDAFNQGATLVHFLGHGGRFVWRTGPLDLRGATDLFSADTLASLQANKHLPMVLSMTCSSGPFDHPTAGSLAESFLATPGRGAMAVLAASWRVPPSERFSHMLVESLLQPGKPVGLAVLEAKQRERRRSLVESYNLLGDPALSLSGAASP